MFQPDAPDAAAIDARLSCRARVESLLAFLQHQRAGLVARQAALQAQLSQFGLDTPEAIRLACEGLSASEREASRPAGGGGQPDGAPPNPRPRRFHQML
jgi:hypothetical protein